MPNACAAESAVKPGIRFAAAALALGAGLVAIAFVIALISQPFYYDVDFSRAPILAFTGLFVGAGTIYLPLAWLVPRLPISPYTLATMLLIGLLMRALLFGSYPVLEIDYYRYLWDGAVLANGFNPYALPPAQVPGSELESLAMQAGLVFERINYRELSSIYPPLAQLLFALAHWLEPWQADGLRYLYLLADGMALLLILSILRRLGLSPLWSCIYWWNPLLVILTYNGLHMDLLLLPLLMLALQSMIVQRPLVACGALTLAAGIKLWPLLLLPFALRGLLTRRRPLAMAIGSVVTIGSVGILPMLLFGSADHSGLAAFSQHWQRNSALFTQLVGLLSLYSDAAEIHARLLVALILVLLPCYLLRREPADASQLIRWITITIAALFLLSPVQLPWYCLWFLPWLCFYPQPALLLLCALMPIYFLRFYFDFRGEAALFDHGIVWLQYLPPLALLLLLPRNRRGATEPLPRHV
ncbi:MAG: DUF2029 domain-containing protein [Gammaproteobacteria bacterium]|nr:DUF2029 domain-containing protein [Gammaproteobacteria bacterium]